MRILGVTASGVSVGDYELIQTQILGSSASLVTFSNLANFNTTYRHLQIRAVARTDAANWLGEPLFRVNGVSSTSYAFHRVAGGGSSVFSDAVSSQTSMNRVVFTGATSPTGSYGAVVIDLLDAYSTTKNKTFRMLNGNQSGNAPTVLIQLASGGFFDAQSVSSLSFDMTSSNFVAGSRFSLYGIRG